MQKVAETSLGFISKAEEPQDFIDLADKIGPHFGGLYHCGYPLNMESIKSFFSNPLRFKNCYVYFYFNKDGEPKSVIWWMKDYDPRINKKILLEYMWASTDPRYSVRVLDESIKHISSFYKYDSIVISNSQNYEKLDKFYLKKGFERDVKLFYKNT